MKQITIIPLKKAKNIIIKEKLYYYICQDYAYFLELKNKFGDDIEIKNLSGLFDEVFQDIKEPLIELMASINKRNNSFDWWGGELASKSTTSTSLMHNVTCLFSVKYLLSNLSQDICFIVDSLALSKCIKTLAIKEGYDVKDYQKIYNVYFSVIRYRLIYVCRILLYLFDAMQSRKAALKLLKPLPPKKISTNKRIIIRSWFTEDTFNNVEIYKDRNFGQLPEWLRSRDYEIWTLPMLFNLSSSFEKAYTFMSVQENSFIVPEHYLKIVDYFKVIYWNYKTHRIRIKSAEIKEIDITPLIDEVVIKTKYSRYMLSFNLCVPLLKRLKEKEFEIDGFYYSFENNTSEKQFILACRKYFQDSNIIAFQHTTFFPNQLAYHLGLDEKEYCPLPDKIICSGPIYVDLHKKAKFPPDILVSGPNLRFSSVHEYQIKSSVPSCDTKKALLLPLSLSHNLAFELFTKVKEAIKNNNVYKIYIRIHPTLSKNKLNCFIEKIGLNDYEFADDGIIQDWFDKTYAMILTGASMATLEAVVMGIPVIRVVPDNTFSLDPFAWSDYPLAPANHSSEIKQRLQSIDHILNNDKEAFQKIAKRILPEYFTKPSNENLKVFL